MGPLPIVLFLVVGGTDVPSPPPNGPESSVPSAANDAPLNGADRVKWVVKKTIGPTSLLVGAFDAGWGLYRDHPREYGDGMEGYGKRYGLRLSSVGTSSVMEAGLGAIWHEDPRYHPAHEGSARDRLHHALNMTIMAKRSDGSLAPAYARYIAIAGSNAISDAWRPDSQRTVGNTMERIGFSFGGRFVGNLFKEFWPDVKNRMFWNKH